MNFGLSVEWKSLVYPAKDAGEDAVRGPMWFRATAPQPANRSGGAPG